MICVKFYERLASHSPKNTNKEYLMNTSNCKVSASVLPIIDSTPPVTSSCQGCTQVASVEDFPIAQFMRFLKHICLHRLLKKVSDRRVPQKTRYRLDFLLQWALSVFFFRTESLNGLQQSFDRLDSHRRKALWNFFGLPEGTPLPHRQTVTDSLALIDPKEINTLLMQLFKWALKHKVFYNHQNVLGVTFGLACDGFVVHHYENPHSTNEDRKSTRLNSSH